jgi:branched-chain amino acid aminotransferase
MAHIILNHTLVQAEKATVSIHDRGFRYGDGAFETIAIYDGVPYRFEWHMKRLAGSLEAIRINYDIISLWEECRNLLAANRVTHGLLRIQITRGSGGRGYLPEPAEPTCVIETMLLSEIPTQPVALYGSSYAKIPAISLPAEKLCQGLNSTLARMEAADYGCFDALMLGDKGYIAETSSANIFWLKDDILYTPALGCGAMAGSIRSAIIALSPYPVEEVQANITALANANAVFLTNVAWKALAVNQLKPAGLQWESTDAAMRFKTLLEQAMRQESLENQNDWRKEAAA